MGRLDALVFPPVVEAHPALCLPFPDVADTRRPDVVSSWDVGRDAAHPAFPDTVAALLEVRRPVRTDADAGK